MPRPPERARLRAQLALAAEAGAMHGDLDAHLAHAAEFWPDDLRVDRAADLGAGGGLPGLVLAVAHPGTSWLLIERRQRRADVLRRAIAALALTDRVEVTEIDAADVGRSPDWRGRFDLVTARSFASPAVVAELGAPLLRVGGRLVVSEPPGGRTWPAAGLGLLALRDLGRRAGVRELEQFAPCPAVYPRRAGAASRKPLFECST